MMSTDCIKWQARVLTMSPTINLDLNFGKLASLNKTQTRQVDVKLRPGVANNLANHSVSAYDIPQTTCVGNDIVKQGFVPTAYY